ncbi:hypothetical protein RFI_29091 [Reticulomyxa filosa]|uniref:Replication protein A subunit n=1 Tax=Reticulomyxa filosa TaxID=46433 RepID=X6M499_RETFI|nr:hypothetical protein RFI_29091 [Reticulomyxa filosa]|eukprot:ETO08297.1 hypothetical protein RFI_29091 [Reticulomyxa filosa]
MSIELTKNALSRVANNDTSFKPVLQLLEVRKVVTEKGERTRSEHGNIQFFVTMSEKFFSYTMNTKNDIDQTRTLVPLQKYAIVRLNEFVCNELDNKKAIILIRLDVLSDGVKTIGNPTALGQGNENVGSMANGATGPVRKNGGPYQQAPSNAKPPQNEKAQNNTFQYTSNSSNNNKVNYQPVSSLNPYQTSWRIKVRVTAKDLVRPYKNDRGEGKVASLDLLDEMGGEIRATLFNDAVDKWYSIMNKNGVYYISRGKVTVAKKQFTHIANDYSIVLDANSDIQICADDKTIEGQKYRFTKIASIKDLNKTDFCDVIGVCERVSDVSVVHSNKSGKDTPKRTFVICDETGKIEVTLWGNAAEEYTENKLGHLTIVALKACRVNDFARSVKKLPSVAETTRLKQWLNTNKGDLSTIEMLTSLDGTQGGANSGNDRVNWNEVKQAQIGLSSDPKSKGEYFTLKGTITAISHSQEKPPWYKAAPGNDTKAKVTDDGRGTWYCAQNQKTYDRYEPRYLLRFCLTDWSGQTWTNAFNDQAEIVLNNVKAQEAEAMLNRGDGDAYEAVFRNACFKNKVFKIRARTDTYQDERRVKYDVVSVTPLDILLRKSSDGKKNEREKEEISCLDRLLVFSFFTYLKAIFFIEKKLNVSFNSSILFQSFNFPSVIQKNLFGTNFHKIARNVFWVLLPFKKNRFVSPMSKFHFNQKKNGFKSNPNCKLKQRTHSYYFIIQQSCHKTKSLFLKDQTDL